MKKYELTDETIKVKDTILHRIKAIRSFGDVKAGDLGGFIEKEENLSHNGNAWVYENAKVYGNAFIYDNAEVYGNARVLGDARVNKNALVHGNVVVYGDVYISNNADIKDSRDYTTIKGFGSNQRETTFYRGVNTIMVVCGCFSGTIEDFREKVKETHGDSKLAIEYLKIADLMAYHFEED